MQTLTPLIIEWASAKGILAHGTPLAQARKLVEEANETLAAVEFWEAFPELRTDDDWNKITDGIGDVTVVNTILAHMYQTNVRDCTQEAYDEIAGRVGEMVDGTFVRERGVA